MATVLKQQDSRWERVLYLALELSNREWKLAFSAGEGIRKKSIPSLLSTKARACFGP